MLTGQRVGQFAFAEGSTGQLCTPHRLVFAAEGADETGVASVAVWLTGAFGEPKAGWLFPAQQAHADPRIARRLIAAAGQGLLAEWCPPAGLELLDRLGEAAGVPAPGSGRRTVIEVHRVVADIELESAKMSLTTSAPTPPAPRDTGCPIVDRVLGATDVLRWCITRWRELQDARRARSAPAAPGWVERPFPPYWARQLAVARYRSLIGGPMLTTGPQ